MDVNSTVNQVFNEKKLSLIRTYALEFMVALMVGAIMFLTWWQFATNKKVEVLQNEMKAYLYGDSQKMMKAIDNNTESFKRTTEVMDEVKYFIRDSKTK